MPATPNSGTSTPTSQESSTPAPEESQSTSTQSSEQSTPAPESSEGGESTATVADALNAFAEFNASGGRTKPAATGSEQDISEDASDDTPENVIPGISQPAGKRPGKGLNSKRKYDGLDDNEKAFFDQMSTPAYEYLYPRHLKSKEYEKQLKDLQDQNKTLQEVSFYDQDGAWKITPEYENLSLNIQQIGAETNFWKQQLANARAGNKVVMFLGYNQQTGEAQYSEELDPTPDVEADILGALNNSQVIARDLHNKITGLENGFKQKHSSYKENLNAVRTKIFNGADLTKLGSLAEKKLEAFPPHVRSRPEVKMLGEAWVVIDGLLALLNKAKQNTVSNGIKRNIAASAGPAADRVQSGAGGVASVKSALNDFRKAGF